MNCADELPRDTRDKLLSAATRAFLEQGYGVSMDSIASRAGVAKQTLYNHFSGKDELFRAVVTAGGQGMDMALANTGGDLRTRLLQFARTFRGVVLESGCVALYRTIVAEALRFPQMSQSFYEAGPGHSVTQLSTQLLQEMQAGRLQCSQEDMAAEARFAAEMLLGMLIGTERGRLLLGMEPLAEHLDDERSTRIVDRFLQAFGYNVSATSGGPRA